MPLMFVKKNTVYFYSSDFGLVTLPPKSFKLRQFKFKMHTKMSDKCIKAFILCILQGKPNIQFLLNCPEVSKNNN